MCNLYRMRRTVAEVARTFRVEADPGANVVDDIYPGYNGLVIAEGRARAMTWGFPRILKGKNGQPLKPRPVTNARNDNLASPFWRDSFARRRCLVPATAWAEPEGERRQMTCTWHSLPGGEMFAIAGLWRWSQEWGEVYAMVMVDSCAQMAEVHDRMPVVLKPEQWEQWTKAPADEAFDLIQTWCDELAIERTDVRWGKA